MPELAKWDNFYVIVGSAAGALIGLQFVVLTLIADKPPVGAEGSRRRVRQSDDRPLQRRVASVGTSACAVADNYHGGVVLGSCGLRRDGLYGDRYRTNAKAAGIQTTIRGLVVSHRVALHRVCDARDLGILGSVAHTRCLVCRGRRGVNVAFHRHPQCLGQRRLPCAGKHGECP